MGTSNVNDDRRVSADTRLKEGAATKELGVEWIRNLYAFDNLPMVQVFTHKNFRATLKCRADDHGFAE